MSGPTVIPPTPANLAAAALALQDGRLVAIPTETVYGLAADATNDQAVAAIFAAKGRPSFNPLIVHLAHMDEAAGLVELDEGAEKLMLRFWPGPLTLVMKRRADCPISLLCSAGLDTLAVRCPSHPLARNMIEAAGVPLAAPSANRSGSVSPTSAQHVAESFRGKEHPAFAYILAGGKSHVGVESTVLDLTTDPPTLLRPGAVLREQIEETLEEKITLSSCDAARPNAPGQLASHYAPRAAVKLDVRSPAVDEAYLAFGTHHGSKGKMFLNLSENGDLDEAAANLFAYLRQLDDSGIGTIAVAPIPEIGLGLAVNDRLRRAAAPKS
jgi:L-threonylcarbamoyladenylate synthase